MVATLQEENTYYSLWKKNLEGGESYYNPGHDIRPWRPRAATRGQSGKPRSIELAQPVKIHSVYSIYSVAEQTKHAVLASGRALTLQLLQHYIDSYTRRLGKELFLFLTQAISYSRLQSCKHLL